MKRRKGREEGSGTLKSAIHFYGIPKINGEKCEKRKQQAKMA